MLTFTVAVVPTKNRHELVRGLMKSLVGQVDHIIVVDNNDVADSYDDVHPTWVGRIHVPGYPPNLSALYNTGIHAARAYVHSFVNAHATAWNVALLNDDVVCPSGWTESLDAALRETSAALAYTDRMGRTERVLYTTPPIGQHDAATVWACVMRGELGIGFDEAMQWWYSDNDLDLRCRRLGGTVAVPGPIPQHLHPSEQTMRDAVLSAQAHRDGETFNAKWAGVSW